MTTIEELSELRGLYARAVNAFRSTPKDDVRKRRLRALQMYSLAAAVDATERIVDYPHQQTRPLDVDIEALEAM